MDWQIAKEVGDLVGKVGLAFIGKAVWDRYWERRKERRQDVQTETAQQADFKKALLSVAAGVVETQVKELREHITRLETQIERLRMENREYERQTAELTQQLRILQEENATLHSRIDTFERQTSHVDR